MIKWETLRTADDLLDSVKKIKMQWLNTERDRLISAGITHNGQRFQTREKDVADLMGLIQVAQLAPTMNMRWLTEDNIEVAMTLPDLQALGLAIAQHKTQLVYQCRAHKDAINGMTSEAQINAYITNITW